MSRRSDDATKFLTLDEIRARDIDNVTLVWKACREYHFDHPNQAAVFIGVKLAEALKKMGVDITQHLKSQMMPILYPRKPMNVVVDDVEKQLVRNDVRVERRRYTDPEDVLRSGLYIYHGNEIAYFISDPFLERGLNTLKGKPKDSESRIIVSPHQKWEDPSKRVVIYSNI